MLEKTLWGLSIGEATRQRKEIVGNRIGKELGYYKSEEDSRLHV